MVAGLFESVVMNLRVGNVVWVRCRNGLGVVWWFFPSLYTSFTHFSLVCVYGMECVNRRE